MTKLKKATRKHENFPLKNSAECLVASGSQWSEIKTWRNFSHIPEVNLERLHEVVMNQTVTDQFSKQEIYISDSALAFIRIALRLLFMIRIFVPSLNPQTNLLSPLMRKSTVCFQFFIEFLKQIIHAQMPFIKTFALFHWVFGASKPQTFWSICAWKIMNELSFFT